MSVDQVIERHRSAGREFSADGVQSFVLDRGDGEPVVLIHGVPSSSFLYRKVIDELVAGGMRGVAFDLPGLGLAARPADYDYSWTGLGRFCRGAVDALGLDGFHLVVHDVGGPVGFELAATVPERVRSLTILNTMAHVADFRRPWVMEPFARRRVGEAWLASMVPPTFIPLMWYFGVENRRAVPRDELLAYLPLLKRVDRGKAFLKIMRGFERTAAKEELYTGALTAARYPIRIVWGAKDPALPLAREATKVAELLGGMPIRALPGRHFFQEDCAPQIAAEIAANVRDAVGAAAAEQAAP